MHFSSHLTVLLLPSPSVTSVDHNDHSPDWTGLSQQHSPSAECFFFWVCNTMHTWIIFHFCEYSFPTSSAGLCFMTCPLTFGMFQALFLGSLVFSIYNISLSDFNEAYDFNVICTLMNSKCISSALMPTLSSRNATTQNLILDI